MDGLPLGSISTWACVPGHVSLVTIQVYLGTKLDFHVTLISP
jgi:hypothetical protein